MALTVAEAQPVTLLADGLSGRSAGRRLAGRADVAAPDLLLARGDVPRPSGAVVVDASHPKPARSSRRPPWDRRRRLAGPCYLSLRSLIASYQPADGIVILAETGAGAHRPGRRRRHRHPVAGHRASTPGVARSIDAG